MPPGYATWSFHNGYIAETQKDCLQPDETVINEKSAFFIFKDPGSMKQTSYTAAQAEQFKGLTQGTIGLMAMAAGLYVANIYYNQPMLGILAREFHERPDAVSYVAVATQVGYALGMVLLASLGDCFERRRLILITSVALSFSLILAAFSPSLHVLVGASLFVGFLATVAQQVVPMAAHLASEHMRGQVVGTVMSGLLAGILLARTVSGVISEYGTWREMFGIAAVFSLVMGIVLSFRLPKSEPMVRISYTETLCSLFKLFRKYSVLRRSALVQALLFAAFTSFWANLAVFLEMPPFSKGSSVAGLLGLLGVAGVMAAPFTGKLADRYTKGKGKVIALGSAVVAVSFVIFAAFRTSWAALFIGIVLMDIGMQAALISNQSRIYALDAAARSRMNTVFLTVIFIGGSIGAAVSAHIFEAYGWLGIGLLGAAFGAAAFAVETLMSGDDKKNLRNF